jgi:SAM-dependent methyltransferase
LPLPGRADRVVIGADLTRAALRLGAAAAQRFGLDRVQFVETDLRRPGLKAGSFDVVYSSGVVHHTPDPRASFASVVRLARPGGVIVLGVYNAFARIPLRMRRLVARLSGFRVIPFDPVLRDRRNEPARREAWLRDQYQHPEEHRHTLAEVQGWFAENRVEYLRAYPSAVLGEEPGELFSRAADNWRPEGWLAQLGWMRAHGHQGGLFSQSAGGCSAGLSPREKARSTFPVVLFPVYPEPANNMPPAMAGPGPHRAASLRLRSPSEALHRVTPNGDRPVEKARALSCPPERRRPGWRSARRSPPPWARSRRHFDGGDHFFSVWSCTAATPPVPAKIRVLLVRSPAEGNHADGQLLDELSLPHDRALSVGVVAPDDPALLPCHQNPPSIGERPQNRRGAKVEIGAQILGAILR